MIRNYFKIAWRNLVRNKVYSAINIFGLAAGLSACILIFLYVQDELTYERHFKDQDRIVRVVSDIIFQGKHDKFASTPSILSRTLYGQYPEIETVTKLLSVNKQTLWIGEKAFNQEDLVFADSTFFRVFDYPFITGDPQTALDKPKTIVLTEELAVKFFGSPREAMGKLIQFSKNTHQVTGVIRNPRHSHLKFSGLLSAVTLQPIPNRPFDGPVSGNWIGFNWYTYLLLRDRKQVKPLKAKLDALSKNTINPWLKENNLSATLEFHLQPIRDIHFNTDWQYDLSPAGNRSYLYIFGFVALLILVIACINYMNLATARSAKRAREVGLRKVIGAHRFQLIRQFIGESVFLTLIAVVLALALVEILLPLFNELADKNFSLVYFAQPVFLAALGGLILLVGLLAGSYPAFFLSGFEPVVVLKSDKSPRGGHAWLRKSLVVLQFTISLVMIIGTWVVMSQMQFLKNRNLGFNPHQLLAIDIPAGDSILLKRLPDLKEDLLRHPDIESLAIGTTLPGGEISRLVSLIEKEGKQEEKSSAVIFGDYGYLDLLGVRLVKGRNFSPDFPTDRKGAVLVNQAFVRQMGWADPLGKRIQFDDWDAKVVGVVQDFHFTSLHQTIEPVIVALLPQSPGYLVARVKGQDLAPTIRFLEDQWSVFAPRHPLEFFFLDDYFDRQYRAEEKMLTIFSYFATLTILIACLGLFGLTSFTAEQRTKEIGIRKVLGSSVKDIILLLSRDFALLVVIAVVLACPLAWYGMHYWLQDFAFRTPLKPGIFLLSGGFCLLLAMVTVGLQALKAAAANPVKALRSE